MPDGFVSFGTKPDIVISPYSFDKEVFLKIGFFYDYLGRKPVLVSLLDFRSLFFVVRDSVSAKIKEISKRHLLGRGVSEVLSLADTIGKLGEDVLTPKHSFGAISLDSWTKEGKEKHQVLKEASDFLKEEILHSGFAEFVKKRAEEDPDFDNFLLKKPTKLTGEVLFALEESVNREGSEWGFVLSWSFNGGGFRFKPDLEDLIKALEEVFGPGSRNLDLESLERGDVGGWYIYDPSVTKILIGAETIVKERGIKVVLEHEDSFSIGVPVRVHFVLASYSDEFQVDFAESGNRRSVEDENGQRVFYWVNENSRVIYYNRFLLSLHDKGVGVRVETYDPDTTKEYEDIFKKKKKENESKLLAVEPLSEEIVASGPISKLSSWKNELSLVKEVFERLPELGSYSSESLRNTILLSPHLSVLRSLREEKDPGACLSGNKVEILDNLEMVAFKNIEFIRFLKRFYGEGNTNMPKRGSLYNVFVISREAIEGVIRDNITIEDIFSRDSRAFLVLEKSPTLEKNPISEDLWPPHEDIKLFLYITKNPVVLFGDKMELLDGSTGTRLSFVRGGEPFYQYDFGKGAKSVILGKLLSFYKKVK